MKRYMRERWSCSGRIGGKVGEQVERNRGDGTEDTVGYTREEPETLPVPEGFRNAADLTTQPNWGELCPRK